MYIIVGLGNPGREYAGTRHNVGFDMIDRLAAQENIGVLEKKHKAVIGKGVVSGQKCILAKPQTFMNLSGESIRELLGYYKADVSSQLIVISDDISLEPGQLRIRKKGSAGGHNGLKNIIAHLGTQDFPRIKIGTGAPAGGGEEMVDWVTGVPSQAEREVLFESFERAVQAVACVIEHGCQRAMNEFN